jgi:hypothetical protein
MSNGATLPQDDLNPLGAADLKERWEGNACLQSPDFCWQRVCQAVVVGCVEETFQDALHCEAAALAHVRRPAGSRDSAGLRYHLDLSGGNS